MLEKVIEIIIDQTCAPASIHTSYNDAGIKLGDTDTSPIYL